MKLMDPIMVAVDFDESLSLVLEKSLFLAKLYEAEILPVHIVDSVPYSRFGAGTTLNDEYEEKRTRLDEIISSLKTSGVSIAKPIVRLGDVTNDLIKIADKEKVSMIILGAKERSTVTRIMLGSYAEKIVKHASCPTFIVHPRDNGRIEKILCAIDYADHTTEVLDSAIQLSRTMDISLEIMHVCKMPTLTELAKQHSSENDINKLHDQFLDSKLEELEDIVEDYDTSGVEAEITIKLGDFQDVIEYEAKRQPYALLVMGGGHHHNWLHDLVKRTTNEKIVRKLPCNVLTIKGQGPFKVHHELDDITFGLLNDRETLEQIANNEIPEKVLSHYDLGVEMLNDGLLEDAIIEFQYCVNVVPNLYQGFEKMAEAYDRMHDKQKSEYYKTIVHIQESFVHSELDKSA